MAAITSAANTGVTEMELIASIVQENLIEEAVLLNTASDWSQYAEDGVKSFDVPRFATGATGRFGDPEDQNPDGETPVAKKTVTLDVDTINLDQWKNLAYTIPDRVIKQSRVALEAELAKQAGKDMASYVDKEIRDEYRTLTQSVTMTGPADAALALTSTMALTDINEARRVLNANNVPQSDRFLILPPGQEKAMLNIDNFIKADEYGSREALLNGEIGRVYGFRVIMSNQLSDDEAFAVHKDCVAYAMQKSIEFETQRADVTLKATDYSYSMGWGHTLTYGGLKGVKFETAP